MNSYYDKFLRELLGLDLDESVCKHYMANHSLDIKLMEIIEASKEVAQLQPLLTDVKHIPNLLFEEVLQNLRQQQDKIIDFYTRWFERENFMGDHKAYENPDLIVVLGCNRTMLNIRMESAIKYFKIHPNAYAVLSGGGFSSANTESDYMLELAREANIRNHVIQEKTSMDTLGNAFFTKLLLKGKNALIPNLKILIITSQFHAPRALYYFNTIFNNTEAFEIAVKGVKTTDKNIEKLALHELSTEYKAESSTGIFKNDKKDQIDDTAILIKLFQHHILYRNRYDILREFLNIANQK